MAEKRKVTAREAKNNLEPFGYDGPARWTSIDAFVKANPRARAAVTASKGLMVGGIALTDAITAGGFYKGGLGTPEYRMGESYRQAGDHTGPPYDRAGHTAGWQGSDGGYSGAHSIPHVG